ncbi:MAG: hypothetical protein HFG89_01540 [Dorea sp.]|jgi:hypothetical protein|nr:hypothetical protein [Dorea sp.]
MPDWNRHIFLIVVLVNALIAVLYLLWGILVVVSIKERKTEKEWERMFDNRRAFLIKFFVMLLCPVIGPLFFVISYLLDKALFWTAPDLEDVIFSKDRVKIQLKADEERVRNMVPLEEALAINEKKDLRMVMMNMVKGEIQDSLAAIALALDSEDSESSHYAASVMTDELNEFRRRVQTLSWEIMQEDEGETEYEEMLIDYMNQVLKLRIFTIIEQRRFVHIMADTAEKLRQKDQSKLKEEQYESVCLRLMEIEDYTDSEKWCAWLAEQYPERLSAYTCRLKLYFTLQNKEAFFTTLNDLKRSDVVIDRETLELIRVFS